MVNSDKLKEQLREVHPNVEVTEDGRIYTVTMKPNLRIWDTQVNHYMDFDSCRYSLDHDMSPHDFSHAFPIPLTEVQTRSFANYDPFFEKTLFRQECKFTFDSKYIEEYLNRQNNAEVDEWSETGMPPVELTSENVQDILETKLKQYLKKHEYFDCPSPEHVYDPCEDIFSSYCATFGRRLS